MLEDIRLYIIEKLTKQRKLYQSYASPLCLRIQDKLDNTKKESDKWTPTWIGDLVELKFKIKSKLDKYVVNIKEGTCSCQV